MRSIDNLREYVLTAPSICSTTRAILVGYVDEIEREVEELRDRDYRNGREDAKGAVEFADRLKAAVDKREDVTLWGVDYMPLPLDFEDEPIRVGDWVDVGDGKQRVEAVTPDAVYWWEKDGCHWVRAHMVTRHRARTVEEVLREFLDATSATQPQYVPARAAEFAKRVGWCDYADRMRELGVEVDA